MYKVLINSNHDKYTNKKLNDLDELCDLLKVRVNLESSDLL